MRWEDAYLGVAHNNLAGNSFYDSQDVLVQIDGVWVEYEVVESGIFLCENVHPNCNNAVFLRMYEPKAIILATCWPRGEITQGQLIIKLMPKTDKECIGVLDFC